MARPLRIQAAGLYHVTARGTGRERVFRHNVDRELFLERLDEVVGRCRWLCHAYCLMGTHFHLLLETTLQGALADGVQRLVGHYAQNFNRRYRRAGHLFQGRYHAVSIERDAHLLEVARYVVLNPVRARLCSVPEQWEWSSYRATAGLEPSPAFLNVAPVLGLFAGGERSAHARYRAFVAEGGESPWHRIRQRRAPGTSALVRGLAVGVEGGDALHVGGGRASARQSPS